MTDFDPTPRGIAKRQARAAAATALTKWRHRAPDPQPEPRPAQPCRHCGNPNHTAPTCPQKATT